MQLYIETFSKKRGAILCLIDSSLSLQTVALLH